jgi:hypothetical protein
MTTSEKLSIREGTPLGLNDATQYRSAVGALQYLTLTQPDIFFAINKVYQFLHSPTTVHWATIKSILLALVLKYHSVDHYLLVGFQMQIGQAHLMIEDLLEDMLYS